LRRREARRSRLKGGCSQDWLPHKSRRRAYGTGRRSAHDQVDIAADAKRPVPPLLGLIELVELQADSTAVVFTAFCAGAKPGTVRLWD
jgi:hypothetical protein